MFQAEGNSTYSDPSPPINTPVMVVPKPPTGVRVTALHMTHAHLSWKVEDDGGADMLAYVVLRQRDEHGDYVEGVLCNTVVSAASSAFTSQLVTYRTP